MDFHDDGVFCVELTSFSGNMRSDAQANGFSWFAAILLHDPAAQRNRNDLHLNMATYRHEGWHVCGWGTYGQADTPENDARTAAQVVRDLGLDGWIANGEAWAEGANRGYSQRFISTWKQTGVTVPLAVSCLSSDTDQFARDFDYQAWIANQSVIMPQVYGNEHATYTVAACLGMLDLAGVPQSSLNLTFGTYGPVNPYTDYQGWSGPRAAYVGERTPITGWPQLARTSARSGTPPKPPMPDSSWYQQPYPRAKHPAYSGVLPFPLYPPDSASSGKNPSPRTPLTVAIKRGISRGGRWPWQQFDDVYSNGFSHGTSGDVINTGVAGFQRQQGIESTGWLGSATFDQLNNSLIPAGLPHAGELLFDAEAVKLIKKAAQPPQKTPEQLCAGFCVEAEQHEVVWTYTQKRPYTGLGVPPDQHHDNDCSGYVTLAYNWAGWPDPNHTNYNGSGNTGSLSDSPHVSDAGPFKVGDLELFGASWGQTDHVIICKVAGSTTTSKWSSHGEESGPEERPFRYRTDHLGVVRPTKQ